jgi:hypothetical protein
MDTLETAALYIVGFAGLLFLLNAFYALYALWHLHRAERRNWLAEETVLLHMLLVSGLTAFNYAYATSLESEAIRWLVYAICSPTLVLSAYEITAPYRAKGYKQTGWPIALWTALVCTIVSVSSGYFLSPRALTDAVFWSGFSLSSLVFLAILIFFNKAIAGAPGDLVLQSNSNYTAVIIFSLGWFVYPIAFALRRAIPGNFPVQAAQIAYVGADLITKFAFGLYARYRAYIRDLSIQQMDKDAVMLTRD